MNPQLQYALADLREETVRLCRRIRQSHHRVPLPFEFGTASSSDPLLTAEVEEREVADRDLTHSVREVPLGTITLRPRPQSTNSPQIRNDGHPKPTGAHRVLLLVLLLALVIALAIAVWMQTEINELMNKWIPILNDTARRFETLIRGFWPK